MRYTPDARTSTAVNKFEPGLKPPCRSAQMNVTPNRNPQTIWMINILRKALGSQSQTLVTSEKNCKTFSKSKDLVLLLIFNFSISVTNALPTTKENICVSTNL